MKTTKFNLLNSFLNGLPCVLQSKAFRGASVRFDVINSIERESGSNRTYNVTGLVMGTKKTVFVETED